MRYTRQAFCWRALILAAVFTIDHSPAQTAQTATVRVTKPDAGDYAVTERGANYRIWQKTTVEHGTNRVHRYVELATGMYYTNSYGQLTEASEQITLLPQGGAAATQGRHQVYFPADIYNGVLEVVTPDGKHLKSRPLGVSYDDGSNTAFIATLKHSVGYLTSSNQVTYPDAFTGFKADLVCTYRRNGFESDLVFRQQPPTPDQVGLRNSGSTLQMVTEFFNTPDPQQTTGRPDKRSGLQDTTLKFGGLTMTHGKAFAVTTTNAATIKSRTPVYKKWLQVQGRTFLIEQVPLLAIAKDLDALPLTASAKPRPQANQTLFASQAREFPPAHGVITDTNQMLIASAGFNQKPGVVLDYEEINADLSDYTFASDTTYLVDGEVYLGGTTTFIGGAIIKVDMAGGFYTDSGSTIEWDTAPYDSAIFTSVNDDSVGVSMAGSGDPYYTGTPAWSDADFFQGNDFQVHDANFSYGGTAFEVNGDVSFTNVQFFDCSDCFVGSDTVTLDNSLISHCGYVADLYQVNGNNVTFDQLPYGIIFAGNATLNNCILSGVTNIIFYWSGSSTVDASAYYTLSGNNNGFYQSPEFGDNTVTDAGYPFQSEGENHYYLATESPFRDVGTTGIDSGLLADLQISTTYTPEDGAYPDTDTPDLGYHYAILSISPPTTADDPNEPSLCPNEYRDIDLNGYASDSYSLPLTFSVASLPAHGTVTNTGGGHFTYHPSSCYEGTDSFTFMVNDGYQDSAPATVTLTVTDIMYVAYSPSSAQTCQNIPLNITLNDYDNCDEDPSTFTYTVLASPTNGVLLGTAPNLTYSNTSPTFTGIDSFTYKVSTACGNSATNTVTITVGDQSISPNPQTVLTGTNQPLNLTLTASGSLGCTNAFTYTIINNPTNGTLSGTGANRTYMPNANYEGVDHFTFNVIDGIWSNSPARVTIFVVAGPTNLTAQCLLNGAGILLNWRLDDKVQHLEDDEGLTIYNFQIYRATVHGGPYTPIYTAFDYSQTNYVDLDAAPGGTYYYVVAFSYQDPYTGTNYESPPSNEAAITTCCPTDTGTALWVNYGPTPQQLAQWLMGTNITVTNATYTGAIVARGIFGNGSGTGLTNMDTGLILSSGNITNAIGPNNDPAASTIFGTNGDADLDALVGGGGTEDAAVLEFDIISPTNFISFQYIFASEEYPSFVGSYDDVCGIFVDETNIALIPGTSEPVSVFTVNASTNSQYFIDNGDPGVETNTPVFNIQYNGLTTNLTAAVSISTNVVHHIKIAVADYEDHSLDSAIFLKAKVTCP